MKNKWYTDLDEYIRKGEPGQAERSGNWLVAIGLQQVDGLSVSDYLIDTAKEHIEGRIDIYEVQDRIASYYANRGERIATEENNREADMVSSRITKELNEQGFHFSPAEWITIHKRLFEGILDGAGYVRDYNITKDEWVLGGDTVVYTSYHSILETLNYDFDCEKSFNYKELSIDEMIKHIAKFTSDIWQIHPFCEGNTRATAVFIIKYLKTLGLEMTNEVFAEHSWFFRNALVRANYNNISSGIYATTKYLEMFFRNFLLGKDNELKNRYMHVDYNDERTVKENHFSYNVIESRNQ